MPGGVEDTHSVPDLVISAVSFEPSQTLNVRLNSSIDMRQDTRTRSDRWKMAVPDALCWEHWGEESVLFDRRSSQTHLLTAMATECLLLLQDADLDLDQLTEKLEGRFEPDTERVTRGQVSQLLVTLSELGLITTVSK